MPTNGEQVHKGWWANAGRTSNERYVDAHRNLAIWQWTKKKSSLWTYMLFRVTWKKNAALLLFQQFQQHISVILWILLLRTGCQFHQIGLDIICMLHNVFFFFLYKRNLQRTFKNKFKLLLNLGLIYLLLICSYWFYTRVGLNCFCSLAFLQIIGIYLQILSFKLKYKFLCLKWHDLKSERWQTLHDW